MEIKQQRTVCFTGHRPEKLPDGGNPSSQYVKIIKSFLYNEIVSAVKDGYDTFVTGMQRGIDLWAGEAVLSLAADYDLSLVAVLPYRSIGKSFRSADKWLYGRICGSADEIVIISEEYSPSCMAMRNRFMVDNSSRIIAVMGSEKSGTGQTLRYARKQGLEIRCINLKKLFPESSQIENQLTLL